MVQIAKCANFLKFTSIVVLVLLVSGCKATECAKLLGRVQAAVFIIQVIQAEIGSCVENPESPTCNSNEVGGLKLALAQAEDLHKQLVGTYEAKGCDMSELPGIPEPGETLDPFGDL